MVYRVVCRIATYTLDHQGRYNCCTGPDLTVCCRPPKSTTLYSTALTLFRLRSSASSPLLKLAVITRSATLTSLSSEASLSLTLSHDYLTSLHHRRARTVMISSNYAVVVVVTFKLRRRLRSAAAEERVSSSFSSLHSEGKKRTEGGANNPERVYQGRWKITPWPEGAAI